MILHAAAAKGGAGGMGGVAARKAMEPMPPLGGAHRVGGGGAVGEKVVLLKTANKRSPRKEPKIKQQQQHQHQEMMQQQVGTRAILTTIRYPGAFPKRLLVCDYSSSSSSCSNISSTSRTSSRRQSTLQLGKHVHPSVPYRYLCLGRSLAQCDTQLRPVPQPSRWCCSGQFSMEES